MLIQAHAKAVGGYYFDDGFIKFHCNVVGSPLYRTV